MRTRMWMALLMASAAFGADWPQWRGINRDGVWTETGIVETLTAPPAVRWRTAVSGGYSGPTVAKGKVYLTDRITDPNQVERVHCFDAETGATLWTHAYPCKYRKVGYPDGPRASVLVHNGRAYSLGTMGYAFCFDADTGEVIWKRDLFADYQIRMPIWGVSASPLIEQDVLILQIGGKDGACVIGLDVNTGRQRWQALNDKASYSAPIVIDQAGVRVLVCLTGERVVGMNPVDGTLHWACPFKPTRMPIGIATPVFHNNYLFVTSFYDGSLLLKVDPDTLNVTECWRRLGKNEKETEALHCMMSTPILTDDAIYGVDSYGQLRCLDLATGDRLWENLDAVPTARWANIHLVQNGDKTWMFNERGELLISRLNPQQCQLLSRVQLIEPTVGQLNSRGGVCWSHPAFANRCVYLRNDNELICVDLSAD